MDDINNNDSQQQSEATSDIVASEDSLEPTEVADSEVEELESRQNNVQRSAAKRHQFNSVVEQPRRARKAGLEASNKLKSHYGSLHVHQIQQLRTQGGDNQHSKAKPAIALTAERRKLISGDQKRMQRSSKSNHVSWAVPIYRNQGMENLAWR